MSTDAAHSLAGSFDLPLVAEPTPICSNLWGQEADVFEEMEPHWSTVHQWLAGLKQWQWMDKIVAAEVAVLPGMEELVGLLNINLHYEQQEYDLLIVDAHPRRRP